MQTRAGDRSIVISADGHAGAQLHEYRPYHEAKYRSDLDEWTMSFVSPWTLHPAANVGLSSLGVAVENREKE